MASERDGNDDKTREQVQKVSDDIRKQLNDEGIDATVETVRNDGYELRIKFKGFELNAQGATSLAKLGWQILIFLVGMLAASTTLFSEFSKFQDALVDLFHRSGGSSGLLISNAYAQSSGAMGASFQIVPIIVYLIYVLLSVGYVVCLIFVFKGSTAKDRANAMEMLKTLTAFFIGAISGKAV